MGWILNGRSMHDDTTDTTMLAHCVPDIVPDKFHVWISKYHYLPIVILAVLLFAFGGWPFLVWGIFLRTVVGLHATWLVNSATHMWGSRRFATRDDSTNNWFVAFLTFGEGWHNNHHAHPTSARHGVEWYEIDMNWYGIWVLKAFGLATQIRRVRLSKSVREEGFNRMHQGKIDGAQAR
jgi:sn-1 stearoyl-lipid 9-desaturase